MGQAISVNGTNGISVPDNASLDFGAGADFSVDAWIKTANTARNTLTIVDKRFLQDLMLLDTRSTYTTGK